MSAMGGELPLGDYRLRCSSGLQFLTHVDPEQVRERTGCVAWDLLHQGVDVIAVSSAHSIPSHFPDSSVRRVGDKPFQGSDVRGPAVCIQGLWLKLYEAIFVGPENRGAETVK